MNTKPLDLQKMAGTLNSDLDSLLHVIADVPKCPCNHGDASECHQQPCTRTSACHVNIRQALHHMRYATLATFKHELEVLDMFLSPSALDRHKAKQEKLSSTINAVIGQYNASRNCLVTMAGLNTIAGTMTDYTSSVEITMKQCLSHSQQMAAA